ncbi:response regulator [Phycisphaerales bacterium ac7]
MAEKRRQTKSKAGGRILIVDDDPIVAESLSEFLAQRATAPRSASTRPKRSNSCARRLLPKAARLDGRSRSTSC